MPFCADSLISKTSTFQVGDEGENPVSALQIFHGLTWVECKSKQETSIFRETIDQFHSYMKYKDTCNRRINWNVYRDGVPIAAVGINSALLALGCRDNFIGWDATTRKKFLNCVANNYRFALRVSKDSDKNLGSKILAGLRKFSRTAWKKKYGDDLLLLETLVKPPWTGAVYKADNWKFVGMTKGFSFSKAPLGLWKKEKSARGELARTNPEAAVAKYAVGNKSYVITRSEPKLVFVFPLDKNFKHVLSR